MSNADSTSSSWLDELEDAGERMVSLRGLIEERKARMQNITVKKEQLLKVMEANKAKHRAVFEAAVEGYRKEAMRLLEEHIAQLKRGSTREILIHLPVPKDHTSDYERVIGMVKMDVAETFVLTENDYSQYVDDNWNWSREWGTTATRYAAGATMSNYGGKFSEGG